MDNVVKNIRFCKDYNLPINIFNDEFFSYYKKLYAEFWPLKEENLMNKEIEACNGIVEDWLHKYSELRDNIINTLENSVEYAEFNKLMLSNFAIPNNIVGQYDLYTETNDGKTFVSVDLKKANFQALKFVGVIKDNTYDDFIKSFGGTEYFAKSKYLRQVIFGKLNPKRQITIEKYLIYKVYEYLTNPNNFKFTENWKLYSINSDELIFSINFDDVYDKWYFDDAEYRIKNNLDTIVKIEPIYIKRLPIVNSNGNKVDAYIKRNLFTCDETLKKASTTFFPQIWKLYKGLEIQPIDRMFYFENQIATFNEPLKLLAQNDY